MSAGIRATRRAAGAAAVVVDRALVERARRPAPTSGGARRRSRAPTAISVIAALSRRAAVTAADSASSALSEPSTATSRRCRWSSPRPRRAQVVATLMRSLPGGRWWRPLAGDVDAALAAQRHLAQQRDRGERDEPERSRGEEDLADAAAVGVLDDLRRPAPAAWTRRAPGRRCPAASMPAVGQAGGDRRLARGGRAARRARRRRPRRRVLRKNATSERPAPMSSKRTVFCTTSTRFCISMPTPAPITNMKAPSSTRLVVSSSVPISAEAGGQQRGADQHEALVAAGAAHEPADDRRGEEQADDHRDRQQAGLRRRLAARDLHVLAEEDGRAEHRDADGDRSRSRRARPCGRANSRSGISGSRTRRSTQHGGDEQRRTPSGDERGGLPGEPVVLLAGERDPDQQRRDAAGDQRRAGVVDLDLAAAAREVAACAAGRRTRRRRTARRCRSTSASRASR